MRVQPLRYAAPAIGVLLALLFLPALTATAQIYRIETEDGVIYTDQPPAEDAGAEVEIIELPETNTSPPPEARPAAIPNPAAAAPAPELSVAITSPANETTIAMGPGNFSVSARAEPPLARGERLLLRIDGEAQGAAQPGASWRVVGALRGPHDLVVERLAGNGQILARSESVRVYVLRPSILRR